MRSRVIATIVYYACALCSISLLYSPYTKRAAFFLSELEAKSMPHCTGRGKKLHIHIQNIAVMRPNFSPDRAIIIMMIKNKKIMKKCAFIIPSC